MTAAIPVNVRRVERAPLDIEADLRRARLLANWLDAQFSIGNIRFGIDAIVGVVPVLGDTLSALAGLYPIYLARKHNLGKRVQSQMAANVLIDWAVGEIPILGDLFDVQFKSNLRNVALLEKAAKKR